MKLQFPSSQNMLIISLCLWNSSKKVIEHISTVPMELQFPSLQNLFILFLFLSTVVKLLRRWKLGENSNGKLPPGPRRLPLIGNLHQLFGSLPHHILTDLAKKHGPLMYLKLGEVSTIVISSPEIVKEVFITNGIIFAERPHVALIDIMSYNSRDLSIAPYGGFWRQLRKICTVELLSTKRVQSFRFIREEEVSALVRLIASNEGSPINLTEKFVTLSSGITCKAAFGSKCDNQDAYIGLVKEFVKLSTGLSLPDVYPSIKMLQVITGLKQKYEKLFQQSDRVIQGILDNHKEILIAETNIDEQTEEDLVTTLLKLQKNGDLEFPLTDINIKALILDVFSAGTETSATALGWVMAEILRNPRVLERAQREVRTITGSKRQVDETCIPELKYLKAVIKETFRLHPPLPLSFPRANSEKCVINGYEIPANTRVMVNTWAMGRDPNYWSEPEMFLPERFLDSPIDFKGTDFEFIPFGAGRRICPGISFGLANIELPLAELLYHFDWNLPNGKRLEDLDMTGEFGIAVTRKDVLILVPTTYKDSLFK